ncbi:hypothetical protein SMSP2_02782 [Limihaloglobus sulfuriphilus]|uniref:PEP-CTERM protein-sorting domain-containing protein n=1 Tax=Limihaloglobus sulfuriphilus TaxID=1851148 RepID=A0A1Q2MIQ2_9BACT|nr:PEP-CTERM sorting domain-containing protein [Limihaloglobus sulfuriphilus]AQQ72398.1 hypothetical protein SMSP2_02782 [Limihaloglobus sulfuriphilus]
MNLTTMCLAVVIAICSAALANPDYTITLTAMADGSGLGYNSGSTYDFSFVLNGSRTESNNDTFDDTYNSWFSANTSDDPLYLDIYGSGLSGTYQRPNGASNDPQENVIVNSNGLDISVNAYETDDLNLTTLDGNNIDPIITDYFLLSGVTLDYSDTSYVSPETYFADYLGQYSVSGSPTLTLMTTGPDAYFDINSVTITPEPATAIIFGLGGLFIRRRRT